MHIWYVIIKRWYWTCTQSNIYTLIHNMCHIWMHMHIANAFLKMYTIFCIRADVPLMSPNDEIYLRKWSKFKQNKNEWLKDVSVHISNEHMLNHQALNDANSQQPTAYYNVYIIMKTGGNVKLHLINYFRWFVQLVSFFTMRTLLLCVFLF